ncbi:MAG: exodeoxyribonuclease VII large subunit [Spirochaetota bacterium]
MSAAPSAEKIITVGALVRAVREDLETRYASIAVVGEISRMTIASSGHCYFDLKDEQAVVSCVMFAGAAARLPFRPEEGLRVVVYGRASIYDKRGQFQLNLIAMRPEGAGALAIAFEQLKKKLAALGYFESARKRTIAPFPRTVGIVTSPNAAALQDMLRISGERAPGIDIIIYPTIVQGEKAAENIASMIRLANERREVDVLIVGRGGGSLEDLWAFNEEPVAKAIFESEIPVVSAVGHETDTSIADLVADIRAATPSHAVEIVFPDTVGMTDFVRDAVRRMLASFESRLGLYHEVMKRFDRDHLVSLMKRRLERTTVDLDHTAARLYRGIDTALASGKQHFASLTATLSLVSPLAVLSRGYAIVSDVNGSIVRDAGAVNTGDAVSVRLHAGELSCRIEGTRT